jgi:hypothetical protein
VARVHVTINTGNMLWFLTSPAGPIVRTVTTYTRRTLNAGRAGAPVDTGLGRAAMNSSVSVAAGKVIGRVFLPTHLWFQALGTGIYGPRGTPIRPKHGPFLVWEARNGGDKPGGRNLIFAREVRGVPRNDWMIDALRASCPWPVNVLR